MWNLKKYDTNELTYKTERDRLRDWIYGCHGEEIVRAFGMDMYTHCYISNG